MKFDIKTIISRIPFLQSILKWAKTQSIPGFRGVPVYDVIKFTLMELKDDDISTRANSMSFSFFIALFPGLIFLFTLIPLLPQNIQATLDISSYIHGFLPVQSELYILNVIDDILNRPRGGLLSFGLITSMFFASNGMLSMIYSFGKSDPLYKSRSWWKKRLVALILTIVVVFIFFASSIFIVMGDFIIHWIVDYLDLGSWTRFIFQLIRWLGVTSLIYFSVGFIYRYGPAMKRRNSFFSIGTNLSTILIILTSLGFSFFVSQFGRYNELYGSIGALIVFLIWLNLICFVLLVGFELNNSVAVHSFQEAEPNASTENANE